MKTRIVKIIGSMALLASVVRTGAAADSGWECTVVRGDWSAARSAVGEDLSGLNALQSVSVGYDSVSTTDFTAARKAFSRASEMVTRDADSALAEAARLTREQAADWRSHLLHADILARAGRYGEAEAAATRAVGLAPSEPLPYLVRGLIHALAGREAAAQGDIACAIEVNPKLADGYVSQGILHVRQGKPAEAQKVFQVALRLAPGYAVAANARGVALCQEGQFEEAIRAFVFALDLDPDYEAPAHNLKVAKELVAAGPSSELDGPGSSLAILCSCDEGRQAREIKLVQHGLFRTVNSTFQGTPVSGFATPVPTSRAPHDTFVGTAACSPMKS